MQAVEGFGLEGNPEFHQKNLMNLYQQYEPALPSIETLIILQV